MELKQYEVIGGIKYTMSPTNFFHYSASKKLADAIEGMTKDTALKIVQDVSLTPKGTTIKIFPDVAIFKAPIHYTSKGSIRDIPVFVAEVVSPGTRPRDFTTKKDTYAQLGVKEYWIVDPYGKYVITYRLDSASLTYGKAAVHQYNDEEETAPAGSVSLSVDETPSIQINLAELFHIDGEMVD